MPCVSDSESHNKRTIQVSTETDHGEDDIDLSALEIETISAHLSDHADSNDGKFCKIVKNLDAQHVAVMTLIFEQCDFTLE